jgi:hypothetical protein
MMEPGLAIFIPLISKIFVDSLQKLILIGFHIFSCTEYSLDHDFHFTSDICSFSILIKLFYRQPTF